MYVIEAVELVQGFYSVVREFNGVEKPTDSSDEDEVWILRNPTVEMEMKTGDEVQTSLNTYELLVITVRNSSCGKAMFSQAYVKNSVRGGGVHPSRQTPLPAADTEQTPPPGRHPSGQTTPPPHQDGNCSRWYASYWNAFLLRRYIWSVIWFTELWLHREKDFIFPDSCSRLIRLLRVWSKKFQYSQNPGFM